MKVKPTNKSDGVTLELRRGDEPLLDAATRLAAKSALHLKHILVPIDFSECSKKALQYALPLAREHQATLTLLYVVAPAFQVGEYPGVDQAQLLANAKKNAKKELTQWAAAEVRAEAPTDIIVHMGTPSRQIIESARSLPADLIVISTHGRTGLKHVLLGSVTEQVVQRAPCPVLVVREREHEILAT
jgi:universal stress protein A